MIDTNTVKHAAYATATHLLSKKVSSNLYYSYVGGPSSSKRAYIRANTAPQLEICVPSIPYAIACNANGPLIHLMNFYR